MMDDWAPLQPEPWTPSLLGSTDRPRSVLRFGLVMAQASTDPKGLGTIFMEAPARVAQQTFHQPNLVSVLRCTLISP